MASLTLLDVPFWSRVRVDPDGCWEWLGVKKAHGYGSFTTWSEGKAKTLIAHCWAYQLLVGPIPDGLQIDHLCRNRGCVRPEHLEPVTHRENQLRGESFSAQNARKTHCVHGHALNAANTIRRSGARAGRRECLTCKNARRRVR